MPWAGALTVRNVLESHCWWSVDGPLLTLTIFMSWIYFKCVENCINVASGNFGEESEILTEDFLLGHIWVGYKEHFSLLWIWLSRPRLGLHVIPTSVCLSRSCSVTSPFTRLQQFLCRWKVYIILVSGKPKLINTGHHHLPRNFGAGFWEVSKVHRVWRHFLDLLDSVANNRNSFEIKFHQKGICKLSVVSWTLTPERKRGRKGSWLSA